MAFRNLLIESPAHISVKNGQLLIRTDREYSVPTEDISALLVEDNRTTITAAALSLLGESGCAVFFCDAKHLPCAVTTPFAGHSRSLGVLRRQTEAGEPLKKRLWQSIVQAKIRNQAACLAMNDHPEDAAALTAMTGRVRSGDPDNVEATAAQRYFPALFAPGFTRSAETGTNAALNYGYAILRGCMARYLSVYGFLPSMGLHHRNELNPFNLADDMMEPFRPVADMLVTRFPPGDSLTPEDKRRLFNLLNLDILSGEQHHSVAYAMERAVRSLTRSLEENRAELCLPTLLELQQHRYE